jgi:hypothetical protein
LQGRCPGQRQRSYATVANLLFKDFARPAENCRCARFADSNLNTGDLRVVESLQQQQMTPVVYNNDDNRGAAFFRLGLSHGRDFLRSIEREHFLHRQLRLCSSRERQ